MREPSFSADLDILEVPSSSDMTRAPSSTMSASNRACRRGASPSSRRGR